MYWLKTSNTLYERFIECKRVLGNTYTIVARSNSEKVEESGRSRTDHTQIVDVSLKMSLSQLTVSSRPMQKGRQNFYKSVEKNKLTQLHNNIVANSFVDHNPAFPSSLQTEWKYPTCRNRGPDWPSAEMVGVPFDLWLLFTQQKLSYWKLNWKLPRGREYAWQRQEEKANLFLFLLRLPVANASSAWRKHQRGKWESRWTPNKKRFYLRKQLSNKRR